MVALRENDLANCRPPLPSLTTTRGGTIAAVCSRCRSQRNFTNSPWTGRALLEDVQLMAQDEEFGFQPLWRLEPIPQHAQKQ
jgi:hypothetical protein